MATIYPVSAQSQAPATPIKGAVVTNSEVSPHAETPAPQYLQKDPFTSTGFKPDGHGFGNYKPHPELPIGNPLLDAKDHLSCHKYFTSNIDVLMRAYEVMKNDLDQERSARAQAEREVIKEQEEKEAAQREAEIYKKAYAEAVTDLQSVRADLVATEARLELAVKQLRETVERLERTRAELRAVTRERDELLRTVAEVRRQLEFQMARAKELQAALDIANAGENAANDRNTRLTELLYHIEAQKAAIERVKDQAQADVRRLELALEQHRQGLDLQELRSQIHAQEVIILAQVAELDTREKELAAAQTTIHARGQTIKKLNGELHERRLALKKLRDAKATLDRLVKDYRAGVNKIPTKYHKHFPQEMHILQTFNYSMELNNLNALQDIDSDNEAEGPTESAEQEAGESSTAAEAKAVEAEQPTAENIDETEPTNTDA